MKYPGHASVLAVAALLCACSHPSPWKEYVYKDQHFAAAFTAPPKAGTEMGPLVVEQSDGTIDLGVTAACNIKTDKSPDQMMEAAIAGTRENGTVRNVTYIAIGQTMGREMLVDQSGGPAVRQRVFVKNGCLYLVFASAKDGPDSEAVTHFLDSFRFL